MGKNFLGLDGLKHFWTKAKSWIAEQITAEVTAKIAEIVANAPEDLDTLKEIADWISTHANDAAAMNTAILANTEAISGKADKSHTHTKSEITDFPTSLKNPAALTVNGETYDGSSAVNAGVQTVANGGTGQTTANAAANSFINSLTVGNDVPVDDDYYVCQSAGGGTTTTTYHRRPVSKLWEYIKAKISSVLGLTKDNYGGKASTAGTADKTVNDITIDIPYIAESGQYVILLGNILQPGSSETGSPYNWDITGFFSIVRNSGHAGLHLNFEAGHGYSHGFTTYAYLDEANFTEAGDMWTSIKAFQYNGEWWMGLWLNTQWQGYTSKMTITYSKGLPATPTCILYNSDSNGVANEEINNSIQDIPAWWWKARTIYNPTTFNDKLYTNGVITPRKGTIDGATVSIGRADGNITIGDTNNNNAGFTVINNDCEMLKSLNVSGDALSSFKGECDFGNISVHSKTLFPSGYVPRTYFIERATNNNITTAEKELLRKMFAYQSVNRLIQCYGTLVYKINSADKFLGGRIVTVGYFDGDDWLDSNDNISYDDNSTVNYACFGVQNDSEGINIVDMYNLSERVMRNRFEDLNYLIVSRLYFTVLEKV